jgi:hypothetical protein
VGSIHVQGATDWDDNRGGNDPFGREVVLIRQRDFVGGLGCAAVWPLAALGYIEGENPRRDVVSLKTAKGIGVEVPTSLLLNADRVIE